MRGNAPNRHTEDRTAQKTVQILLTVCGIVFLALGLVLAASGMSINSAIGTVSDELGGSGASDDSGTAASDDSDASDGGNETEAGDSNSTDETDGSDETGTDSGDSTGDDGGDANDGDAGDGETDSDDGSDADDTDGGSDTDGSDETQTLTTTVEDADGAPVDGATVTVAPESGSNETQTVDGTGEAEFDLEDGQYEVTANADGYETATDSVTIDGDDDSITLTLENQSTGDGSNGSDGGNETDANDGDGTHTLTVTVEDGNGMPINNATVTSTEDTFFGSSETQNVNGSGEATFDLEDGSYTVAAEADGYDENTRDVEIDGDDKSITLVLQKD
ncbi:hypothetical protein Htur_1147 [Haloterrigena turkmenica DSM 5511]|uniref:Cna B domain protein n=1 Tax=Haloterrigena turkmenica (strain ATCC 51198 / DSM 5511 / JCM 9101 / NCIMB 13204 / VKM B-1734 / 4k) TaxID=543526 RepID=D2RZB5_HALTV|nr:hypothetical protein Htur_1147 [Haloterrigena turkmenica DSM 5511]